MKPLGEVDWSKYQTQVWVPCENGQQVRAWVLIVKGDALCGRGFVLQVPPHASVRVGQRVWYAGGTPGGVRPKLTKSAAALCAAKLRQMASDWLKTQMTFDPDKHSTFQRWFSTVGLYW